MPIDPEELLMAFRTLLIDHPDLIHGVLKEYLLTYGSASISKAKKVLVSGIWQTQVTAVVQPAAGEWLASPPQATLYQNDVIIAGPAAMQIQSLLTNTWVANFATGQQPNFAKIEVTFEDPTPSLTTKTDIDPVTT